jgi:heme A synthase
MEVDAMQWDLGLQGLGVLVAMSLGFGVIAQVFFGRTTTRWLWAIVSTAHFLGSLFISEVWFGWANEEDLQPNIDGLSFDEVLLIGLVPVVVAVLLSMYVAQRRRRVTSVSAPDGELSTMSREPTFLEHNRREATTKK